jgi:hypothetical protein
LIILILIVIVVVRDDDDGDESDGDSKDDDDHEISVICTWSQCGWKVSFVKSGALTVKTAVTIW